MKLKRTLLKIIVLFVIYLSVVPHLGANPQTKRIRGVIVGYMWDSMLIVRTMKKQYVVLRNRSSAMNPIPETVLQKRRVWNFAVSEEKN